MTSSLLDPPETRGRTRSRARYQPTTQPNLDQQAQERQAAAAAERLRTTMAAVRVSLSWFGVRKSLTPDQKAQAAESFGAEGAFLSAGKKLLDTRHPAFRAVAAVRHHAVAYWRGISLPYPEAGIRLIRQRDIAPFNVQLTTLRAELAEKVTELDQQYSELRAAARTRLGSLYNEADYPPTLAGQFGIDWDFPSVEPPDYLRELSPELYRQESERVAARFDEAVRLAEEAFLAELQRLVSHLIERLTGQEDGKPKIFRDSAVTNLTEFFTRFRTLNVRSSGELDALVEQAQRILGGTEPQQLRDNTVMRSEVARELAQVDSLVDRLLVDRPRRNLLRPVRSREVA